MVNKHLLKSITPICINFLFCPPIFTKNVILKPTYSLKNRHINTCKLTPFPFLPLFISTKYPLLKHSFW